MDPKEVKQLLKEAKEALKKNDPVGAAKPCKTILRKEPENYQANLLIGTACREQGKYQQALEAYKKACQIDGKQVYAWQGIISVYEKQNSKNREQNSDLLDAYKNVATHFEKDDKQKYIENTVKLANILISQEDTPKALKVMVRLAKSAGINLEIAQILVQLMNATRSEIRTEEQDELYTKALDVLVTETPQPAEETYRKLFSQLYRNNQHSQLTQKCLSMQDRWNYYMSPMEFLCRQYLESTIEPSTLIQVGGIEKITDKLFKLHPTSRYGYYSRGKYLIEEQFKYTEGFSWINNALESSYNLHAALALVRGKMKFGDYEGGLEEAAKAIANCGDKQSDFKLPFELLYLEGLIGTNETERAEEQRVKLATIFQENVNHPQAVRYLDLSAQTSLKNKNFSELYSSLSLIEAIESKTGLPIWRLDFYKCINEAAQSKERFGTYIQNCIATHGEIPELMLLAGIFLYDQEEYEITADILLSLAGTDEGRNHPHAWKYLGLLANLEGDKAKAVKYLKRSYDLNLDSDVGALLSDLYQEMGELELKKKLLVDATKKVRKPMSKWVWSRLGLQHLNEGNLIEAVECLQSAIRVDLNDGFLWESLADAYYYRGSLQAAQRCYTKAVEHGVDPLYPKQRMSSIYYSMDEEDKAIQELKELIEIRPEDAPSHLELGKLYCLVAAEKVKENFDAAAISAVEQGLESIVRSIFHSKVQLTLPWVLIGEYSLILSDLPQTTNLRIPALLLRNEENSNESSIEDLLELKPVSLPQFKEIGTKAFFQCLEIITKSNCDTSSKTNQTKELLGYIYHQIALCYYKRSIGNGNDGERKQFLLIGIQYAKKAIAQSRNNSLYWNTIGLIAFHLSDMAFAQNCYIRALQADANNVVAWVNLGILYYQQQNYLLAHKAFAKGQSVAPVYANSWIGQGLCAEVIKPSEAPDLFRHACLLRHHPFAISSYGNAICKFLLDKKSEHSESEDYLYWQWHLLVRMDAVTHLYDLISRVEGREISPQLFNLKGIVSGWNGFNQTSLESFSTALQLATNPAAATLTEEERLRIHSNKVSSLISMKMLTEAWTELMSFSNLDATGSANAAIVLHKLGNNETAMNMYDQIIDLSGEKDEKTVNAKIAKALLYGLNGRVVDAKSILFAPDMRENPQALIMLGSIAATQNDAPLLEGVIQELQRFQHQSQFSQDICFLTICREVLQQTPENALRKVMHFIHMHPTNPKLYALACQLVITYCLGNYRISIPRHLALCTLKISKFVGSSREDVLFASKLSGIASLTHLIEYNDKIAVSATLKAIRCYPEQRDNWAVLACAYWVQYCKEKHPRLVLNTIKIIERETALELCSPKVINWMAGFRLEIAKFGQAA